MATTDAQHGKVRFPVFQGILPIDGSQVPADIIAGITLAALAIPEVMGYTKISGTPEITGLYTLLIPMTLYAIFGGSGTSWSAQTPPRLPFSLPALRPWQRPSRPSGSRWRPSGAHGGGSSVARPDLQARVPGGLPVAHRADRVSLRGRHPGRPRRDLRDAGPAGDGPGTGQASTCNRSSGQTYPRGGVGAVLAIIVGLRRVSKKIPGAIIAVLGAISPVGRSIWNPRSPLLGEVPRGSPGSAYRMCLDWSCKEAGSRRLGDVRRHPDPERRNLTRLCFS